MRVTRTVPPPNDPSKMFDSSVQPALTAIEARLSALIVITAIRMSPSATPGNASTSGVTDVVTALMRTSDARNVAGTGYVSSAVRIRLTL